MASVSWRDELVRRHKQYSEKVFEVLHEVEQVLASEKNAYGTLLIGSASRGELAIFQHKDGKSSLFSDIEFLVVSNSGLRPDTRALLDAKLEAIRSKNYPDSPFFHIDYGWIPLEKVRRMPRDVTTYEAKQTGIPLCGADIRPLIPDVTMDNLDRGGANELILWGLWSLLLHVPINVVRRQGSFYEDAVFLYSLYRSILVVPIIFLPSKGVLLPSYQERTDYIVAHSDQLETDAVFGTGFAKLMQTALAIKLAPQRAAIYDKETLYESTLNLYIQLLQYLVETKGRDFSHVCSSLLQSNLVMKRQSWKRELYELLVGLRHVPYRGLPAIRWLVKPKRKLAICFLLNMHFALLEYLRGHVDTSCSYLKAARDYLNQVSLVSCKNWDSRNFVASWHSMRQCFINFMVRTYRWNVKSQKHYQRILEWTHA